MIAEVDRGERETSDHRPGEWHGSDAIRGLRASLDELAAHLDQARVDPDGSTTEVDLVDA